MNDRDFFKKNPFASLAIFMGMIIVLGGVCYHDNECALLGLLTMFAAANIILMGMISVLESRIKKLEGVDEVS